MMDLFDLPKGMVRLNDHTTSILAAHHVKRVTIRERVLNIARDAGTVGITDDELKAAHPDSPESSIRKRRTELAQENYLLETARTRRNRHGQMERVWMHRDWHLDPPPIVEREKVESKDDQIARLEAEVKRLHIENEETLELLGSALPFVEEAENDPLYKAGYVKSVVKKITAKLSD